MANIIEGDFTIREVLNFTHQKFRSRFLYEKRDVLHRITIKRVRTLSPDRPGEPVVTYEVVSKSYPQYKPYFTKKDKRGRVRRFQRSVSHEYETIFQLDQLSIDTPHWRTRTGSGKKWETHPPQQQIKSIYRENAKKLTDDQKAGIKKTAKYLNVGDWNARVRGIMADFRFRQSYALQVHGHLFGRDEARYWPAPKTNPQSIPFFNKHQIRVLRVLMQNGILSVGTEEIVEGGSDEINDLGDAANRSEQLNR